eukprot:CAMPEP_0173402782 /NCGR_PEP_ID=MMETSP1356-20130122/54910_1 /TAXON_ID=77927 ORGANISM="Hemiselmis virescens, Strain PCC157" /NCGR_SAMPLE_ID=MMETSP1356 /ASSEMBLY_ACC=CAM_ASM_000847 /LENGTH=62 /DNA_ID=CAMNT_0014363179 /DNA_START=194 /DNA_END=378 /DNA_ORIENTATION=-
MSLPFITRIEAFTGPRWGAFATNVIAQRALGVFLLSLALTLTMPIPFTTQPASIALAITTMG